MENPIEMDDLGVPRFSETPTWYYGILKGGAGVCHFEEVLYPIFPYSFL